MTRAAAIIKVRRLFLQHQWPDHPGAVAFGFVLSHRCHKNPQTSPVFRPSRSRVPGRHTMSIPYFHGLLFFLASAVLFAANVRGAEPDRDEPRENRELATGWRF